MKYPLLKLFLLIAIFSIQLQARIWRVDVATSHNPDFTNLQAAHDGASAGDTLYLAGSGADMGDLILTKQLIIIGNGFFLSENPSTQANEFQSRANNITFDPGSEGSKITGISLIGQISVNTDQVTLSKIFTNQDRSSSTITAIISINASNTILEKSFLVNTFTGTSATRRVVGVFSGGNNVLSSNYLSGATPIRALSGGTLIINNVINCIYNYSVVQGSGNIIKNNIHLGLGSIDIPNNTVLNNISDNGLFGTDNNNQNVDISTVFVGYPDQNTYSTDGRWQLAPSSPAIGTGQNGVDCGMFGGSDPYVLSGIPDIPSIYSFSASDSTGGSTTLEVNIQGKVNR